MFRSFFIFLFVLAITAVTAASESVCDMYLAPSTMSGAGRGIIAGKSADAEEQIDSAVSLTIPSAYISDWQLQNYVYASEEEGHSMVLFGVGMLFNHFYPPTVHHYWDTHEIAKSSDNKFVPSTTYSPVGHNTTIPIIRGQEIFTSYGDDSWFTDRGIFLAKKVSETLETSPNEETNKENDPVDASPLIALVTEKDLVENGHCITDVYVAKSDRALGGFGLYATRDFMKGEIVSISPVLTLPAADIEALESKSVFQNYCIAPHNSSVALFPIGYSALANHDKDPNMVMEWYTWPGDTPEKVKDIFDLPVNDLFAKSFAQLDIAYRATRDIEANTELTIFYGHDWINEWAEHLADQVAFYELDDSEQEQLENEDARPIFRHFVEPPSSFSWPALWMQPLPVDEVAASIDTSAEDEL